MFKIIICGLALISYTVAEDVASVTIPWWKKLIMWFKNESPPVVSKVVEGVLEIGEGIAEIGGAVTGNQNMKDLGEGLEDIVEEFEKDK